MDLFFLSLPVLVRDRPKMGYEKRRDLYRKIPEKPGFSGNGILSFAGENWADIQLRSREIRAKESD